MSADLLREAAALMRERAGVATPGPWAYYGHSIIRPAELKDGKAPSYSAAYHREDAEHIASWHPAVALAVADWLETQAARWSQVYSDTQLPSAGIDQPPAIHSGDPAGAATTADHHTRHAINVALAYLGRDS